MKRIKNKVFSIIIIVLIPFHLSFSQTTQIRGRNFFGGFVADILTQKRDIKYDSTKIYFAVQIDEETSYYTWRRSIPMGIYSMDSLFY